MSIRTERIGSVVQQDLGDILQKEYQHDSIITVTRVVVTEDLMIAKVYLSVFSPNREKDTIYEYIDQHNTDIRKKLAGRIRHQVRRIPELHFYPDESAEYVSRMENLFQQIREERNQRDNSEDSKSE